MKTGGKPGSWSYEIRPPRRLRKSGNSRFAGRVGLHVAHPAGSCCKIKRHFHRWGGVGLAGVADLPEEQLEIAFPLRWTAADFRGQ